MIMLRIKQKLRDEEIMETRVNQRRRKFNLKYNARCLDLCSAWLREHVLNMNGRIKIITRIYDYNDITKIMKRLRIYDGCPWDREQDH